MWPRFVARFNREKRGRQVRQHGRDKGGERATARELYFRWIHIGRKDVSWTSSFNTFDSYHFTFFFSFNSIQELFYI